MDAEVHDWREVVKQFVTTIASLLMGTTACVLYPGARVPDLAGEQLAVELERAPRIEIVLQHRHTLDGREEPAAVSASYEMVKSSLERVQEEFSFLDRAAMGMARPDLVLDVETEIAEKGRFNAILSGATLGVIPLFIRSDLVINGTLSTSTGEVLGRYRASAELRGVGQIVLLVAMPVLAFTNLSSEEFSDETFRNFFLQMGRDIETKYPAS
jgi:hypothetical protein